MGDDAKGSYSVARGAKCVLSQESRQWFVEYLPIARGNQTTLFIDGEDYCKELYAQLLNAKKQVFMTGLHFMADFKLVRNGKNDDQYRLASVLKKVADNNVKVYLIVNQFWEDEYDLDNPIKAIVKSQGGLQSYLTESLKLFKLLSSSSNINCRTDIHPGELENEASALLGCLSRPVRRCVRRAHRDLGVLQGALSNRQLSS